MAKAQTDKEKAAAATDEAAVTTHSAEDREAVSTDPADQPNFGMPEGVSTSATRGEIEGLDDVEPEELPNPTVEEQESSAAYIENHPEAGAEPKAD